MGYIYKITNRVNGKIYIGQTSLSSIQDRFDAHIKKANRHVNRYLYDAMNHYGINNFSIEALEHCDKDDLDDREIYWISYYQSNNKEFGYNMTSGGGGGDTWTNNPHKKEIIEKSKRTKLRNGTYGKAAPKGTPSPNKYNFKVDIEVAMEKFSQHPNWKYSVRDEKPEKTKSKSNINWGWYTVYLLMIMTNAVMCTVHGFSLLTWQYWVYATMLILCFVAGSEYRKKE